MIPRQRKEEPLYKWIERIAAHFNVCEDVKDAMLEISKVSYIHGSNDAMDVAKLQSNQIKGILRQLNSINIASEEIFKLINQ